MERIKRFRWVSSPHHNSDHWALIVKIWGSGGLKRYIKERETLPVQPLKARERSKGEEMFATLVAAVDKPEQRAWPENA